jgi:hypothetical protein
MDRRFTFVDSKDNRYALPAQEGSNLLIQDGAPRLTIHDQEYYGCLLHCDHRLLPNLTKEDLALIVIKHNTARVNHGEVMAIPEPITVRPIARHARLVVD